MPIHRSLIPWNLPPSRALAHWLSQRPASSRILDLSGWTVILPVARAGRRTLASLLDACESLNLGLLPPTFSTPAHLADLLLPIQGIPAADATRRLAWINALRASSPISALSAILPDHFAEWWRLAGTVLRTHDTLLAQRLSFRDVAANPALDDPDRWAFLARAEDAYIALLDRAALIDPALFRLANAHDACLPGPLVLAGIVDLDPASRALLSAAATHAQVHILAFAPSSSDDAFDDLGNLRPSWRPPLGIDALPLNVVDDAAAQADALFHWIASLPQPRLAQSISIGLCDERLAPHLERRGDSVGLDLRPAAGRPLAESSPVLLLRGLEAYLSSPSTRTLSVLARHPDLEPFLGLPSAALLRAVDHLTNDHLASDPLHLPPAADAAHRAALALARSSLHDILGPLADPAPRSLADWTAELARFLERIFSHRDLLDALDHDRATLRLHAELLRLARDLRLAPTPGPILAHEAIAAALSLIEPIRIPLRAAPDALEMLGWLDVVFDDAPDVFLTSVNEGALPSRPPRDELLSDRLRRHLNLHDDRTARDAYFLALLLASRRRIAGVSARRGPDREPLLPSSFLATAASLADFVSLWAPEGPARLHPRALSSLPRPAVASAFARAPFDAGGTLPAQPLCLSVTAFGNFLRSPFAFYLERVLNLREIEDEKDELDHALFGALIHRVASSLDDPDLAAETDNARLRARFDEHLDAAVLERFGQSPPLAVLVQKELARSRLHALALWQVGRASEGWQILRVEWPDSDSRIPLVPDDPSCLIRGRIDRIDVHPIHGLQILDLKTGASSTHPNRTHRLKNDWIDLQLPLYRVLARDLLAGRNCELAYLVLDADGDASLRIADWSPDLLDDALLKARHVFNAIRERRFLELGPRPPRNNRLAELCGPPQSPAASLLDEDTE